MKIQLKIVLWLTKQAWSLTIISLICNTAFTQNPSVIFEQPINVVEGGGIPELENSDWFAYALSSVGDINQDGYMDLAIGAPYDDDGGHDRGAIYILFMDSNAQVSSYQKISNTTGGFNGILVDENFFGSEITNVGDLDGNGVNDLVVGANGDDDIEGWSGALWVLFMNSDGTVLGEQKISATVGWPGSPLGTSDRFGKGLDSIGDINGDGVIDIMAGAHEDDDGGNNHGAVYVLLLKPDGTVLEHTKISEVTPGFNANLSNSAGLGWSVACLGDLNLDDNTEVLVSAPFDDVLTSNDGRVWIMSISSTGNLVSNSEISAATSSLLSNYISSDDKFGSAVSNGVGAWCNSNRGIAVGSMNYGNPSVGGVLLLELDEQFHVTDVQVITEGESNFQDDLNPGDKFGRALDLVTDYNGDGSRDLLVGNMVFQGSGGAWIISTGPSSAPSSLSDTLHFCTGDSLFLHPNFEVNNVLWSTGETTDTIVVQNGGVYWLSGELGACLINDSVHVLVNDFPEIDLGPDTTVCNEITLSVVQSGHIVNWSNGESLDSIYLGSSGTYWVSVDGVCGSFGDTVTVNVQENLDISLGADTLICSGSSLVLSPSITSGAPDQILWYNGSQSAIDTIAADGSYWVTVSDGCSVVSDTISISLAYQPVVTIPQDTTVCSNSFTLQASAETYGNYLAVWNTGEEGLLTELDSSGIYFVTVEDVCGVTSDTIILTINEPVSVVLPNDTVICFGDQFELNPAATWNGISEFEWNNGGTDTLLVVLTAGEYWIQATTDCGLISDTIEVGISTGPSVSLIPDTALCGTELELELTATSSIGELDVFWSNGGSSNAITANTSGLYSVTVADHCGSSSDTVHVEFVANIDSVSLQDIYFLCSGDTITLTADVTNANSTVLWSNGETGLSIPVSNSYWYAASVTNECGTHSDTTVVYRTEHEPIHTSLEYLECGSLARIAIDSLKQFTDWLAPLQPTYVWSTGMTDTIITISESGDYWLAKNDYCGTDSAFFSVELDDCWRTDNLPNVITPNNDGVNEMFLPVSELCDVCPYRLQIFNRWGALIFDSPNEGWNGRLKSGQPASTGVYYYLVQVGGFTHNGYIEILP